MQHFDFQDNYIVLLLCSDARKLITAELVIMKLIIRTRSSWLFLL